MIFRNISPRRLLPLCAASLLVLSPAIPAAERPSDLPPAGVDAKANVKVVPPKVAPKKNTRRAAFALKFKDEINLYPTMGMFVMPGEQVQLEPVLEPGKSDFEFRPTGGKIEKAPSVLDKKPSKSWIFTAPKEPGLYPLKIENEARDVVMTLNVFVMVPADEIENGRIEKYPIGKYPAKPLRGNPAYLPPKGFIRVDKDNRYTRVSPNFTIGEFVTKQPAGWPKYVALRERLLLKLELIIDELENQGYPASSLHIMSGFRTPHYNRRIGQKQYSRHQWGDAADVFVDERPKDGNMDDLNQDGRVTKRDASIIYSLVNDLNDNDWYRPFIGGMGLYSPKPGVRGPFVHVDVRGYRARW